jgi:plastocyanin
LDDRRPKRAPFPSPSARLPTLQRFWFVVVLIACGFAVACDHPGPTRELTLVARGMTFVFEDAPQEPNPLISLRAGERVRIVLKNDAPGLLHDLEIPALNVQLEQIRSGQSTEVTFIVPDKPGRHEYRCRPHSELMHGIAEVTR